MDVAFLTPLAGIVAALALVPFAMLVRNRRLGRRLRAAIGLREPRRRFYALPVTALLATGVVLGTSAMQPVLTFDETRQMRTDVETFTVFDTSRSMLASVEPGSPSRLDRAKAAAAALRSELTTIPVGIASVTDRTLPHLFPTADEDVFVATLQKVVGVERPPPIHTLLRRVTALDALAAVGTQGFFTPTVNRRVLVVYTDGETLPPTLARLADVFERPPGILSVFVHVWNRDERVFRGNSPEAGYRADPGSREALERVATVIGGQVVGESELGATIDRVRRLLGDGPTVTRGERRRNVALAPPLAAAAFLPLALLLWRRER